MRSNTVKNLQMALTLIVGNLLLAFAVSAFVIPHTIIMGGATGIGIVLGNLLPVDTAEVVFIVNMLMLILGLV